MNFESNNTAAQKMPPFMICEFLIARFGWNIKRAVINTVNGIVNKKKEILNGRSNNTPHTRRLMMKAEICPVFIWSSPVMRLRQAKMISDIPEEK
jgi:hypothetical protein